MSIDYIILLIIAEIGVTFGLFAVALRKDLAHSCTFKSVLRVYIAGTP